MSFLERRRYSAPQHAWSHLERDYPPARSDVGRWQPAKRRSVLPIVLTVVAAAVIGYVVRSAINQPHPRLVTVDRPERGRSAHSAPQREATATRCAEADDTVRGWQGNTGFSPKDYLHLLPRCNEGGRR